jgi:hypothetical protein
MGGWSPNKARTIRPIQDRSGLRRSHSHGREAGSLPVEQLTKYELVINFKTAKVLGLEIRDCCSPAPPR